MKRLFPTLLICITCLCNIHSQTHSLGLIYDDKRYDANPRLSSALKFTQPPVISLKAFCPTPGNQGSMGSCVGWATGYAALTISEAIRDNRTDIAENTRRGKSALYIYNQIVEGSCDAGSVIDDAMLLIKQKGDCLNSDFNPDDCALAPGDDLHTKAMANKINEYYTLFSVNDDPEFKINATINSLSAKKPVVIGMNVSNSINSVPASGLWNPNFGEAIEGGHALCVIGYNNNTRVFEIMNSWDTDWGNKGFFTMPYDKFGYYCKYGYQIVLSPKSPAAEVELTGTFLFKKYMRTDANSNPVFENVKPMLQDGIYTFAPGTIRKDDFFRIVATNIKKDGFVYIFSIKPDGSSEILFPQTSTDGATIKDIPIVPASNVSITIPVDEKKGISTDQAGEDYLCILYSYKKIEDIKALVAQVQQSAKPFNERLKDALGDRFVDPSNVQYQSNVMSIKTNTQFDKVAAIVLKVNVTD